MKIKIKSLLLLPILTIWASSVAYTQDPAQKGEKAELQEPLQEPYKPRPTAEPPKGWRIMLLENSKVENKIEISPGKEITVGVPAYKLEPTQQKEEKIVIIMDPHYNPLLKNAQEKTLGASITKFSEESELLRKNLKEAIKALENSLNLETKEAKEPKDNKTKANQ